MALIRPGILNLLVLASSALQGAAGMHGWAPDVIGAAGGQQTSPEQYLGVFFTQSPPSPAGRHGSPAHLFRQI